jgi:hypothetical protein
MKNGGKGTFVQDFLQGSALQDVGLTSTFTLAVCQLLLYFPSYMEMKQNARGLFHLL